MAGGQPILLSNGVSVYLDLLEGAAGSHHIVAGWGITRVATITGLKPVWVGQQDTGQLLQQALTELVKITGERGSPCPSIGVPTYLEQFIPEVVTPEVVKIRIVYKGYPAAQIEFDTCLTQVETNVDKDGNLISVQYKYPSNYVLDPRKAGKTIPQGGFVTRPKGEPKYSVRFMATSGLASVTALCAMEGYVNKSAWPVGTIPGAARTWLCSSVRAVSKDGGFSYEICMTFQYREEGWDPLVVFINPDDGKPPPDLVIGTGSKNPKVAKETTFPTFEFTPNQN